MKLSIIVPTYNRSAVLKDLLQSLSDQTDPDFEVVVAIDGATDDTEDMLAALKVPFGLKWVNTQCPGYGLAVARNMGILAADGDLVAIIDDDSFPQPGFVASYKASARRKAITGGPRTPDSASDTRQIWKMQELAKLPACEPMTLEHLRRNYPSAVITECNICMFRDDIIDLGLFSERLKLYGFIGQEFYARAAFSGFRYQFDHDAGIIHRRQQEGASGLNDKRKRREIKIATALRPSLMTPAQFELQKAWAHCSAKAYPQQCALPDLPKSAYLLFPFRFLRNRAGDVKRWLRKRR